MSSFLGSRSTSHSSSSSIKAFMDQLLSLALDSIHPTPAWHDTSCLLILTSTESPCLLLAFSALASPIQPILCIKFLDLNAYNGFCFLNWASLILESYKFYRTSVNHLELYFFSKYNHYYQCIVQTKGATPQTRVSGPCNNERTKE